MYMYICITFATKDDFPLPKALANVGENPGTLNEHPISSPSDENKKI